MEKVEKQIPHQITNQLYQFFEIKTICILFIPISEAAEEHLRKRASGNMKKYKQAFRDEWLELPEFGSWLQRDPNSGERAWCSICESQMAAKHSSLLAHSKSEKHMKCLGERYAIETVANLMKRKDGKKSDEIREMLKMEDGDFQGGHGVDDDDLDDKK